MKICNCERFLEGTNGWVRAAVVKVSDPQGGVKLLRSIKHLYPVEVRPEEPPSVLSPGTQNDTTGVKPNESTSRRPQRQAWDYWGTNSYEHLRL